MASGRKENQLYLSSSGVFGPNLRFITFSVPLWLIWKQAALFFKCFFSLFLLWSHYLIVGYQPSLSPCPEHPLRPEQSWCGFPPILLAASETFPLRAQSLHLWYYNLGFDSKTGENPLSAPGKWNGILSSELKVIYLAAGCHWDWISPTLEGFQSTCISRSLLEKKALGCILCVSWSSSQPPCRGHISRQLFH